MPVDAGIKDVSPFCITVVYTNLPLFLRTAKYALELLQCAYLTIPLLRTFASSPVSTMTYCSKHPDYIYLCYLYKYFFRSDS